MDRHDAPLGTLSRFRANKSLLSLLNAVCLAEKQQIPILVFGLTRSGLEPTIYHTHGEHANHYTNDVVAIIGDATVTVKSRTAVMLERLSCTSTFISFLTKCLVNLILTFFSTACCLVHCLAFSMYNVLLYLYSSD